MFVQFKSNPFFSVHSSISFKQMQSWHMLFRHNSDKCIMYQIKLSSCGLVSDVWDATGQNGQHQHCCCWVKHQATRRRQYKLDSTTGAQQYCSEDWHHSSTDIIRLELIHTWGGGATSSNVLCCRVILSFHWGKNMVKTHQIMNHSNPPPA